MTTDRLPQTTDRGDESNLVRPDFGLKEARDRLFDAVLAASVNLSGRPADYKLPDSDAATRALGENPRVTTPGEKTTQNADGTRITYAPDGKLTRVSDGKQSIELEYSQDGQVKRIVETFRGVTTVLEAGKDFKSGEATVGPDGSVTVLSADGKLKHTVKPDLSCTTSLRGDKPDGSADKIVDVRTKDGGERQFQYDEKTGQLVKIIDKVHTNSGTDLVEVTSRLANSNVWAFESNYGKSGMRTNVVVAANGDFKADEIKQPSRPSDIVDRDNSDAMHRDLSTARARFAQLCASKNVFEGNTATIENWERKFEQRCRDLAHEGRKAPSDQQIMKTYEYLAKILEGSGNVGPRHRRHLVEAALREYAEPNKYINQGSHPSCCLATVERHVVETHPEDHARVLYEAITEKAITSKLRDTTSGKYKQLRLSQQQIEMDGESGGVARGNVNGTNWSYSNKIFQIAAIKLSYPGYQGNGHGFPGAGIDQARRVNNFVCGEKTLPLLNRWYGSKCSFSALQNSLKNGTIAYFVPGHAMAIDKAKVINGVQYVHVDNWWGGHGDGWRRWDRV